MMSTVTFAQSYNVADVTENFDEMPLSEGFYMPEEVMVDVSEEVSSPKRTVATGLYYMKPNEMLYRERFADSGGNYYQRQYTIPFMTDITYVNKASDPSSTNWVYTNDIVNDLQEIQQGEHSTLTKNDAGGITQSINPGYMTYALWLFNSDYTDHYNMAYYDNQDATVFAYNYPVYGSSSFDYPLGFVDNCPQSTYTSSSAYSPGYLFGSATRSGTYNGYDAGHYGDSNYYHTDISITAVTNEASVIFPAPPLPMYCESVQVTVEIMAEENDPSLVLPFTNDAGLTMDIYNYNTGELVYSLVTNNDYYTYWVSSSNSTLGTYAKGFLKFVLKEDDPLFGSMDAPFVIDFPTEIHITGFYSDDVSLGLSGWKYQDCDDTSGMRVGYNHWMDPSGEYELTNRTSWSDTMLPICFYGVMDVIHVAETLYFTNSSTGVQTEVNGYNKLIVSADGKTCSVRDAASSYNIGGAYVRTSRSWIDEEYDTENYYAVELPDWITAMDYEPYGSDTNTYKISFTCEQNTANASREAKVYIQGLGNVSDLEIIVTQLGADGSDGIENVEAPEVAKTGATYNLAGQRVSENAKGIVIKDGKKVLNK